MTEQEAVAYTRYQAALEELSRAAMEWASIKLRQGTTAEPARSTPTDNEVSGLPRMRTKAECVAMLKEQDPASRINERHIQRMIANGQLQAQHIGNRTLVNFDLLVSSLNGAGVPPVQQERPGYGKIRRIKE